MRSTIVCLVLLLAACSSSGNSAPLDYAQDCGCDWTTEYCKLEYAPEQKALDGCAKTTCRTCACLVAATGVGDCTDDGGMLIGTVEEGQ
jgi:hypothetical protein